MIVFRSSEAIIISLIQHFEADFPWKVSLKILNSGLLLKTSTHVVSEVGRKEFFVFSGAGSNLGDLMK